MAICELGSWPISLSSLRETSRKCATAINTDVFEKCKQATSATANNSAERQICSACSKLTSCMQHRRCQEPNISSASQKISSFYGTRTFITVLTRARRLSTWLATVTQSTHSQPVLNIVLPSITTSFKVSPSLRFPHQNPVRTSPHACCMYYPPNPPLFHHSNAIRRGIQIMRGLVLNSIRTQYKNKQRILWLCSSNNLNWFRPFLRLPIPSLRHTATVSPSYMYAAHLNSTTHKTHLPKRQHTPASSIAAVQNN